MSDSPDFTCATNSFWTSSASGSGGVLTLELLRNAIDACTNQRPPELGYIIASKGTVEAAGPMGQGFLDTYFDKMAKDAARVLFGNLHPPVDAFAAGKYALANEWPYEVSESILNDRQTIWDEDFDE